MAIILSGVRQELALCLSHCIYASVSDHSGLQNDVHVNARCGSRGGIISAAARAASGCSGLGRGGISSAGFRRPLSKLNFICNYMLLHGRMLRKCSRTLRNHEPCMCLQVHGCCASLREFARACPLAESEARRRFGKKWLPWRRSSAR